MKASSKPMESTVAGCTGKLKEHFSDRKEELEETQANALFSSWTVD